TRSAFRPRRRDRTHRGRSSLASRARRRTSTATTASGTTAARLSRSRAGRRARAPAARPSSRDVPLRVRDAQVERLDRIARTELARQRHVKPRARKMPLVRIVRDGGTLLLQQRAIPQRAITDEHGTGLENNLSRREHNRLAVDEREHLTPPRI